MTGTAQTKYTTDELADLHNKLLDAFAVKGKGHYLTRINEVFKKNADNARVIYDYFIFEGQQQNLRSSTRLFHSYMLCLASRKMKHKFFLNVNRPDLIAFLESYRPKQETESESWKRYYNTHVMILRKFFRWLHNPDERNPRRWVTPPVVADLKYIEVSTPTRYKATDLWTPEEQLVFLKYCPSPRNRAIHAMLFDTAARPDELLTMNYKDVQFKISTTGQQYGEMHMRRSKTKVRTIPLIFSVPYVKEWLDQHPLKGNPDAPLFIVYGKKNHGNRLSYQSLWQDYTIRYQKRLFPQLLLNPDVSDRDKAYIRNMLTKPWNPYIQRHAGLTEKSSRITESMLKEFAGWTKNSKMPSIYLNYFGNEAGRSILEAYGVENKHGELQAIRTIQCPVCQTPNKPDGKYCSNRKCGHALSPEAYREIKEKEEARDKALSLFAEYIRADNEQKREEVRREVEELRKRMASSQDRQP